ncbi:sensor domain-containing protein [Streptomyces sp. 7R007]
MLDTSRDRPAGNGVGEGVRRVLREPFTAGTWRRFVYQVIAFPVGVACVPLALCGAPTGRWQRALLRRWLGADLGDGPRAGLRHALLATPLNLAAAFVTVYGWSIVPMNLGWPLRAGSDYSDAWGGPTFAGAWAFHAVVGGGGFLLVMPWVGRGLGWAQARLGRRLLTGRRAEAGGAGGAA